MNPRGVTLVELLAAISIMVIVTALALPALQNRLSAARLDAAQGQLQAAALATRADAMRQGRSLSLTAHPIAGGDVELLIAPLTKPDSTSSSGTSSDATIAPAGSKWVTLGAPIKFNPQPPAAADKVERPAKGSAASVPPDVRLAIFCPDGSAVTSPIYLTDGESVLIVTVNPWIGGVKFAPFSAEPFDKSGNDQSDAKPKEALPLRPKGEALTTRRGHNPTRRGAMLLEAVLALAVFVIAGGAILNLVRQTMTGLDQSRLTARAADLAQSAMAKIEAGIETPQTMNGPLERQPGEESMRSGWELRIDTEPSQFRGLSRVTIDAVKRGEGGTESLQAEYKLVQLVRLSGKGEDTAGEKDSLAEKAQQGFSRQNPSAPPVVPPIKPTPPGKGASPK